MLEVSTFSSHLLSIRKKLLLLFFWGGGEGYKMIQSIFMGSMLRGVYEHAPQGELNLM